MADFFAAAKINLHLHITGKRADGYHFLDSLVCFADIGDELSIEPNGEFALDITGEFAGYVDPFDNSVTKAARLLSAELHRSPNVKITLRKNIPPGAGLGGGSADAAATLNGLLKFWSADLPRDKLLALAAKIGSDVPVCMTSEACLMRGIGDKTLPAPEFPCLPAVLIWPSQLASTPSVYKKLQMENFSQETVFRPTYENLDLLIQDLKKTNNDLEPPVFELCPVIKAAITSFDRQNCEFVRMSGSGSSVFGLFKTSQDASVAAGDIKSAHPDWWVKSCLLNKKIHHNDTTAQRI